MRDLIRRLFVTTLLLSGAASAHPSLTGDWQVSIDIPDWQLHDVRTRLQFDQQADGRFAASSRPGAMRDVYGLWRAWLAALLRPELRGGAWVRLVDGRRGVDGAIEATLVSGFAPRLTVHCPAAAVLDCALRRDARPFGRLRAARGAADDAADYRALGDALVAALRAHHYDPRRLQQPGWKRPLARLQRAIADAHDDLDVLAAWQRWSRALPDSHLALVRGGEAVDGTVAHDADESIQLHWEGDVAVLRIADFRLPVDVAAARLQSSFAEIDARAAHALIVDLRGNTGGNLGSMLVAGHLLERSVPAGYFVTRRWWERHAALPADPQRELARFDALDLQQLRTALIDGPGVHGIVQPRRPQYRGPVQVLIDRRSASAVEPLAYLLQQQRRATVIGESSAGAMLSSETFEIAPGWRLRMPVADYRAADGTRLEGRGVKPDVRVRSEEALRKALLGMEDGS